MSRLWFLLLVSFISGGTGSSEKRAACPGAVLIAPKSMRTDPCQTLHAESFCASTICVNLYWLSEPVGTEAGEAAMFSFEEYEQLPDRLNPVRCAEAESGFHKFHSFIFERYSQLTSHIIGILRDHIVPSVKWFPFQDLAASNVWDGIAHIYEHLIGQENDEEWEEQMTTRAVVDHPVFVELKALVESLSTSYAHAIPRKKRSQMETIANYAKLVVDLLDKQQKPPSNLVFLSATHQIASNYPTDFGFAPSPDNPWFAPSNNELPGITDGQAAGQFIETMRKVSEEATKFKDSLVGISTFRATDSEIRDLNDFAKLVRAIAFHEDLMRSGNNAHLSIILFHFDRYICLNLNSVVEYLMVASAASQHSLIPTIVYLCNPPATTKLHASRAVNRLSGRRLRQRLWLQVPGVPMDSMVERSLMVLMDSSISFGFGVTVIFDGNENVGFVGQRKQWLNDMIREVFRVEQSGSVFAYSDDSRTQIVLRPLVEGSQIQRDMLRAVGRLIGLALENDVPMGVRFAPSFIKLLRLVAYKPHVGEYDELLAREDPAFLSGLRAITPDILRTNPELLPFDRLGGLDDNDFVTEDNLELYLQLSKEKKLFVDHAPAMSILRAGIMEVIGGLALNVLTETEISERLCARSTPITADEIWNGMIFRNFVESAERLKNDLRAYIFGLSAERLARFHVFVTGIARLPLDTSKPWIKVFFEESLGHDSLPRSHTCHNELQVPPYVNLGQLVTKFNIAIHEGGTIEGHAGYGT